MRSAASGCSAATANRLEKSLPARSTQVMSSGRTRHHDRVHRATPAEPTPRGGALSQSPGFPCHRPGHAAGFTTRPRQQPAAIAAQNSKPWWSLLIAVLLVPA